MKEEERRESSGRFLRAVYDQREFPIWGFFRFGISKSCCVLFDFFGAALCDWIVVVVVVVIVVVRLCKGMNE